MSEKTSALDLLSQYSSEESDSESQPQTKLNLLPVPDVLLKLFDKKDCVDNHVDDPTLHGGRVRSFPHVRGNWSTFVFIPYKLNIVLKGFLNNAVDIYKPILDLKEIEEPHISLTKTVVLQHHWIDTLVNDIKKSFQHLKRFPISFSSIGVYSNDDKTRTFLSLQLFEGKSQLLECVELMNECLSAFKLPPFYEEASFHMSIGWCVGNKTDVLKSKLEELNSELQKILAEEPEQFEFTVKCVQCKIGNKLFEFSLD